MLGGVAILARYVRLGIAPVADIPIAAYGVSAVSFVTALVALVLLRPRIPKRSAGQTPAQYWADTAVLTRVLRFWFSLEGSGVMAAVGFFLGNRPIGAVLVATIAAFWLNGPGVFEKH
jgi:hypothetical protein